MKKLLSLTLMLVMLLGLASCSNSVDKARLLQCVPENTCGVCLINLEQLTEKMGNSISNDGVKYSDTFSQLMEKLGDTDAVDALYKDGAIDPSWIVIYESDGELYLAGIVKDEKKFKDAVEEVNNDTFTGQDGVEVCDKVVMHDGIFIVADRSRDIDNAIAMIKQDEEKSIYHSDLGKRVEDHDNDFYGIVNINNLPNSNELGYIKMGMAAVFSGAQYAEFTLDFEKGKTECEAELLNSEFKPAKVNSAFKLDKLHGDVLKKLPGGASYVCGFGISPEIINGVMPMLASMAGSEMSAEVEMMMQLLKSINGTIALGFYGDINDSNGNFVIAMEMTDNDTARSTATLVETIGTQSVKGISVESDGKILIVYIGDVDKANTKSIEHLDEIKGSCIGMVTGEDLLKSQMGNVSNLPMGNVVLTVKEDDGSLKTKGISYFNDKSRNSLELLLELFLKF